MISTIKEDLKAYRKSNGKIQWDEPSIICVILYRIGHRIQKSNSPPSELYSILFICHFSFCSIQLSEFIFQEVHRSVED